MSPEIIYQDPTMQLVASGDLFIERWTGRADPAHLRALVEAHGAFVRRVAPARSLHLVHLVKPELAAFGSEIRELIAEHSKVIDPHLAASAVVYPERGLSAGSIRFVVSAATVVRRSRYPFAVFSSVAEAFDWLPCQREHPVGHLADPASMKAWYARIDTALGS